MNRLPIIYIRGYAGSTAGIDAQVDDPFYGFNKGARLTFGLAERGAEVLPIRRPDAAACLAYPQLGAGMRLLNQGSKLVTASQVQLVARAVDVTFHSARREA